jgi:hypothetical protein
MNFRNSKGFVVPALDIFCQSSDKLTCVIYNILVYIPNYLCLFMGFHNACILRFAFVGEVSSALFKLGILVPTILIMLF